ncbi:MAG: 2-C-methyl-D-erythritol 2,4-cyclodiphosphate synthase [Nitriliruptoraceae bacterium]
MRVGNGFDVHPFDDPSSARRLVLGGVEIADTPPLAGHSDADVLTHAVVDSLLGARGWGDIGERFGVDSPETAGASSIAFVAAVIADLHDDGWRVGNLDATVIAQRPRLSGARDDIRARLADVLGVDIDDVGVKFTTTDRLGAIGRGEGIAAWVTCMLTTVRR